MKKDIDESLRKWVRHSRDKKGLQVGGFDEVLSFLMKFDEFLVTKFSFASQNWQNWGGFEYF